MRFSSQRCCTLCNSKVGPSHSEPPNWTPGNRPTSSGIRPALRLGVNFEMELNHLLKEQKSLHFRHQCVLQLCLLANVTDRVMRSEVPMLKVSPVCWLEPNMIDVMHSLTHSGLEVCAPGGSAQADLATNDGQGVFHLRTRCANGSVGLHSRFRRP